MASKFKLTIQEVKHVATLSSLPIAAQRLKKFRSQLKKVIGYMSKIQKLNTDKVSETSQVTNLSNIYREDKVDKTRMLTQKEALSNTKKSYQGYFVVKSIFS